MAKKKSLYGTSTAPRDKPKKRPGRHKKNRNKHEKRQQKNQKKGRQESLEVLHCRYERKKTNNNK